MSAGDGDFRWYIGQGREPEAYHAAGNSRDAAYTQGVNDGWLDTGFTIIEAERSVPSCKRVFYADHVLEQYEEANEECWGEDGSDINPTGHQKMELEMALSDALDAWMQRHSLRGHAWALCNYRHDEFVPPLAARDQTP